jgi:hypothetical protein
VIENMAPVLSLVPGLPRHPARVLAHAA